MTTLNGDSLHVGHAVADTSDNTDEVDEETGDRRTTGASHTVER
ncbi:hypothetical protein [Microbacterium halotolerans]|nr:hypothetical protein [Microbacterium halotolerans]